MRIGRSLYFGMVCLIFAGACRSDDGAASGVAAKIGVTQSTAYGPEAVVFIKNQGTNSQDYTVETAIEGPSLRGAKCIPRTYLTWRDAMLSGSAHIKQLEPGAWFALVVPSYLQLPLKECRAVASVMGRKNGSENVILSRLEKSFALPMPEPFQDPIKTAGTYTTALSVMLTEGSTNRLGSAGEKLFQIQIYIENKSKEPRWVSILDRRIICTTKATVNWAIGPGEFPLGLQSGPVYMPIGSWTVFQQRVWVSGNSVACDVTFDLSEYWSKPPADVGSKWTKVKSVTTSLKPVGTAVYRLVDF